MEYGFNRELYPSQKRVIKNVVETINAKKNAIISSPTGTGKTLSLLCALTTFLKKNKEDDDLFDLFNSNNKNVVYYCSRTHSQLSQAINELKGCKNPYKSVILGSRRVYCVNKNVNKITDNDILNDRCRELVRDECCEYYGKDYYNANTLDIEDLKNLAIKERFCPYYYTKNKASDCQVVFLPYNLLFTREGRNSLDISLKDKIVVIDEAHNIYDTVIQLNSAEVSWDEIRLISTARGLSEDLKLIISRLLDYKLKITGECVETILNFLINCKISKFNMIEISDWIETTKLAQKNDLKCIFEFTKFLRLLTFSDDTGRIFIDKNRIKFSCINPKMYFEELKECRSVIFAGGTMEPIYHIKSIFPDILYYSYPAVNDCFKSVIITETVNKKAVNLNFTYRNELIDDVINTVVALSNPIVSGGIILFVPSQHFIQLFKKSQKICNFRRKVYFEGEISFEDFKKNPEILVAVMGGSLSEGVNFSDDVCRLLVVIGVPYPSKSIEIQERSKNTKEYETIIAMKTVNQTVGRAIRHKDDYAAIVFLDCRYVELKEKLSPWLYPKTKVMKFPDALIEINQFLKTKL